ncbi:ATP-binding protein [bacterium]|nr:ATP-binding protein [bacterium]
MFPFSFKEILSAENIKFKNANTNEQAKILSRFRKYTKEGGFPEILFETKNKQIPVLQEYFSVLLYRDIFDRYNPNNPQAVSETFKTLFSQTSSFYTVNKLVAKIASLGLKVRKDEISDYIDWAEDCYALFSVQLLSPSYSRRQVNPRKIYSIDNGLTSALNVAFSENKELLLENAVFLELRRKTKNIFYYKSKANYEVDLVAEISNKYKLIQVCESLKNEATRRRELRGLQSAMRELSIKHEQIVSMDEREEIKLPEGLIQVIPAWEFFTI